MIGVKPALLKCEFYEINTKLCVCLCPLDTFVIALAQRVEFIGTGGDRSINSSFTCYVNNSFLVKEWEKEEEKKTESNRREGDEIGEVKIKKK